MRDAGLTCCSTLDVAGAAAVVPWRSGFLLLLPAAPDNLARDLDVAADLSQHRHDVVEDALGPLARYDAERGTQLVPTLRAYVQADYNANQTAR